MKLKGSFVKYIFVISFKVKNKSTRHFVKRFLITGYKVKN